jgi:hypothetical protein
MEGRGEIPHVEKRADTKGRGQPAKKGTTDGKVRPTRKEEAAAGYRGPAGKHLNLPQAEWDRLSVDERGELLAQADARNTWLKKLGDCLELIELYVGKRTDDELPWFTIPGSPGMFDHGITAERIEAAIAHLEWTRGLSFGGQATKPRGNGKP